MTNSPDLTVYTDGASVGNPGPAGWAALLNGELLCGGLEYATNNEAELYAIYQAIYHCAPGTHLDIYTDSKMAIGWLARGWRKNNPQIQALCDMIVATKNALNVSVTFHKVEGHSGIQGNEVVNDAAQAEALRQRAKLRRVCRSFAPC